MTGAGALARMPTGEAKAEASNGFSCHAISKKVVGPSFEVVARRCAGKGSKALEMLVRKAKVGGSGNRVKVPMAPHPGLGNADITRTLKWGVSRKGTAAANTAASKPGRTYSCRNSDAGLVEAGFAVSQPAARFVTKKVFGGFERHDSYGFRGHGGDAVGGEYAPDLRHALAGGMIFRQFSRPPGSGAHPGACRRGADSSQRRTSARSANT